MNESETRRRPRFISVLLQSRPGASPGGENAVVSRSVLVLWPLDDHDGAVRVVGAVVTHASKNSPARTAGRRSSRIFWGKSN